MPDAFPDPFIIRKRPTLSTAAALLAREGLPTSDLTVQHLDHFFYSGSDGSPTGLVGLEIYGTDALLRSLVVGANTRALGLGSTLVKHAQDYAVSLEVRSIYLLTTTAEAFFARLGYRRIDRTEAPPSIRSTREFAGLCPASSAFMTRRLQPTGEP